MDSAITGNKEPFRQNGSLNAIMEVAVDKKSQEDTGLPNLS